MKRILLMLLLFPLVFAFFVNCGEEEPPIEPWEPWNEVIHRDTLRPGEHFIFQMEATSLWDTAYFIQPATLGESAIYESSDSVSYHMLFYYPGSSAIGFDTIEVELNRQPGVWAGNSEYFTHFFYFYIQTDGGE